ncbi:MAG: LCP family protein [Bacillota bacterium]|nr:LCP family protein [Bacillota bacterium]
MSDQQENKTTNNRGADKKKQGWSRLKKVLVIVVVVILVAAAAAVVYGLAFIEEVKEPQRVLLDDAEFEEEYDVNELFPDHIVNIALIGFDRGWNREKMGEYLFRPDMLAVFSINFAEDSISVVRIPRDSYVPIYNRGGGYDKINHSFYYGYRSGESDDPDADGMRYTLQTVSNVLGGIPIHYYASVDMYSIVALVDAVGGIYYEVEEPIYDKYWNVGELLVPEGPQVMDGKTYLRYLQYRDSSSGEDLGRIDRQMNLLKETIIYLKKEGKLNDIPTIYRIYKDYVETDLSYKQITALAYYARDLDIGDENFNFYTVPGYGAMKDGIWLQVIEQDARVQIIKEVFGIDVEPWPHIEIKDSPEYLAEQERLRLEEEYGEFYRPVEDEESGAEEEEVNLDEEEAVMVSVPELRGLTVDEARMKLQDLGLAPGGIEERDYEILEKGLVIYSDPPFGKRVPPGTVIGIVVSKGPESQDNSDTGGN